MATGSTSSVMAARDPDIRLMLRVRAGDSAAFADLVERFQHRLVAVMHHLTGHFQEAEELAQEVFLRVYRTRHDYHPTAKFSTWLFAIANNLALNARRDRSRRPPPALGAADGSWAGQAAPGREPAPGDRVQRAELAAVVRAALDQLNERQRMAVVLNKFEDMNYADIAAVMGLTPPAVKSLLSRARDKLRECLAPYIDPDAGPPMPPVPDAD